MKLLMSFTVGYLLSRTFDIAGTIGFILLIACVVLWAAKILEVIAEAKRHSR
ncbi:MAG: hypothetical protein M3Y72_05830 [Acidobacteriota bacterium]|nr:hypothetical protein [Acidobacteriota bacterium]